ncbi:accA, partial [Symbiodinium sp. KB8]
MTTPEDLRANAEYIRMADEFVEVPGGSNNNNYANVRLIVEKAQAVRADAVWAGWGHASEYPTLPDTLKANNIKFIGPSGAAMRALGDKIGSTIIAQSAGVPTIAWNGADVRVKYATEGLSQALIDSASVKSVAEAASAAERVGFPLMIKASEGGGGKGIRKVTDMADLPAAFEAVAGEVPGSPIFLMRLVSAARHLEVQLLADEYGTAISLAGRDCSVQRRHQKIIEEGPVLAAPPSVWRRMEAAAVALAEEVGYANTGTVEYLFADRAATGEVPADAPESERYTFAFLELNPRLQVEHPVTEMITGVNLPAAQLHVAMGIPLHRIPDIRRLYGCAPTGDSTIDFATAQQCLPGGHVIAARITAENPDSGFQPTSGAVEELNFRSIPDVWGYFSVDGTGRVHEFADSQIGHLFAWGADREDARRKMVMVLKEVSIRGDIHTTVEYLADLLQTADFRANAIHTQWLDRRISSNLTPTKPPAILIAVLGAVWTAQGEFKARRAEYVACVKRGQLPSPDLLSLHCSPELIYDDVKFGFQASALSPTSMEVSIGGTAADVHLRELADSGMLVVVGGKSHVVYGQEEASGLRLMVDGATCMFTEEYDPTQLRASQTGKLAKCMVADGAHVAKGTAYAQVEVMKIILAPGDLIAALDLDDPSAVLKSTPFTGTLPQAWLELRGEGVRATTLHAAGTDAASGGAGKAQGAASPTPARHAHPRTAQQLMRSATETLRAALRGFEVSRPALANAWSDRDAAFSDPSLALEELEDVFAVAASRLPYEVHDGLQGVIARHKAKVAAHLGEEGAVTVMDMALPEHMRVRALGAHQVPELQLGEVLAVLDSGKPADMDSTAYAALVQPIRACAERFQRGVLGADRADLLEMLQEYLSVETRWHRIGSSGSRGAAEEVMRDMRSQWIDGGSTDAGLDDIFMTFCAHEHLRARNTVLLGALERVGALLERQKVEESAASGSAAAGGLLSKEDQAERLLHALAELRGSAYAEVALEARQLLIRAQQPSVLQRLMSVETVLKQAELSRRGDGSAGDVLPTTPSESAGEASPQQAGDTEATDPLVSLVNQEQPMAD